MPVSSPHRIVIVGGGAGGLALATQLGRRRAAHGADVLLVDRNATHFWKPRLHEVAVGRIVAGDEHDRPRNVAGGVGHHGEADLVHRLEHHRLGREPRHFLAAGRREAKGKLKPLEDAPGSFVLVKSNEADAG